MDKAFWDERYGSSERIWSGEPNAHLVADTADLAPGRALDVGAGEGADAIWLAERGWDVVAVDISTVALERARQHAESDAPDVAARISWVSSDVLRDELPPGSFDLVSLQFMHFAPDARSVLFEKCFDAVAVDGTIQIVAHHPSDLETTVKRPPMPELFYTADELAALLDDAWTILSADARPRTVNDADDHPVTVHDTVFVARRAR